MTIWTFDPMADYRTVTVVGLGGTGAALARAIARTVYHMKQLNLHAPALCLIDPDRVEDHNVGRQLFTPADVGQYKAEVLARRFSYGLGLAVEWIPEPLDARRHLGYSTLLVGAVDNHLARREMACARAVWVDCGNLYDAGQVVLGNTADVDRVLDALSDEPEENDNRLHYLPHPGLIFPELLEPEQTAPPVPDAPPNGNGSCGELVAAGEQLLLVNDLVAAAAAQYVYRLLHRLPITTFLTFVDADGLAMRSLPICLEELKPYIVR